MYFLIYDASTGGTHGSMQLPDGSMAPMPNMLECTEEQAANAAAYRVDLVASPISIVAIDAATALNTMRDKCADGIDNAVASVYAVWGRFQVEYEAREAAAQAFKAGGYVGDPGLWITSYASAANVGYNEATDTILAQSDKLRGAMVQLAVQRMRKYEVLNAQDLSSAQTLFNEITTNIQAIAATIE